MFEHEMGGELACAALDIYQVQIQFDGGTRGARCILGGTCPPNPRIDAAVYAASCNNSMLYVYPYHRVYNDSREMVFSF